VPVDSHSQPFRFPRGSLVGQAMRRTHLASYFGIGEALSEKVRSNVLKACSIVRQSPQVVAEHLFIEIPEQMERLYAHVGSFQSTLEKAPEIFESVSVDLSIDIFFGMVDGLVDEVLMLQSLIREKASV
jgi:hypothetical protein